MGLTFALKRSGATMGKPLPIAEVYTDTISRLKYMALTAPGHRDDGCPVIFNSTTGPRFVGRAHDYAGANALLLSQGLSAPYLSRMYAADDVPCIVAYG